MRQVQKMLLQTLAFRGTELYLGKQGADASPVCELGQSTPPPATPGSHQGWGGGRAGRQAPCRVPCSDLSAGRNASLQAKELDSLAVE